MADTRAQMHLVSHVHWDPMWYLPFEQYRMRLIRLMGRLLDLLDAQPTYSFMLDGQVSVIDDYLEIEPQELERIRGHVASGRLLIGPWYIQPEEFMISGESHVRNLLLGLKRGRELGGTMTTSYLCDMIGHIAQMPQIVRGFGLDSFVAFRGVPDGRARTTSEFTWEGPDGSQVLFKVMPFGYQNIIPDDEDGFVARVSQMKASLEPWAVTSHILIMQGGDHLEAVPNTLDLIAAYNREAGWDELVQTTLPEHISAVRTWVEGSGSALPIHKGEMRSTHSTPILTGVLTTRMEVKLGSERLSQALERWAEPFCTLDALSGGTHPRSSLDFAWKKQLKNAFHDCIYGAHADSVTPDILNDYKRAGEVLDWAIGDALYSIATRAASQHADGIPVAVFNPCAWERRDVPAQVSIFIEGSEVAREILAFGAQGEPLACQVEAAEPMTHFSDGSGNWRHQGQSRRGHSYRLSVKLPTLPALGFSLVDLRPMDMRRPDERRAYREAVGAQSRRTDLRVFDGGFENRHMRVVLASDGTLDVLHKASGRTYAGLHAFEDGGDAGDQYNYSPPVTDRILSSCLGGATVTLVADGPVRATYRIDTVLDLPTHVVGSIARSECTVPNHTTTFVSLQSDSPILSFRTTVENRSRDHRLRLVFPTGLPCAVAASGGQFDVSERSTSVEGAEGNWEKAWGNYPHRQFVDISDGAIGMAFLDRGLPEYQADGEGRLHITLLRCTGFLSKAGLPERSFGHAGPELPTPAGQEVGAHEFEYGLYLHEGGWREGSVVRWADEFYADLRSAQVDRGTGSGTATGNSFCTMEVRGQGDGARGAALDGDVLLSAFKAGGAPGEVVVRVYNATSLPRICKLTFWRPIVRAQLSDLAERPTADLPLGVGEAHGGEVEIALAPHKIGTVIVTLAEQGEIG